MGMICNWCGTDVTEKTMKEHRRGNHIPAADQNINRQVRKGGIGHNLVTPGGIPVVDEDGHLSIVPDQSKLAEYSKGVLKIAIDDLKSKGVIKSYNIEDSVRRMVQDEVDKKNQEIENLLGHIRRLEKSNQELGEQLHRCQNPGEAKGWD